MFSVCHDPLGVENGDIPDENIRASSEFKTSKHGVGYLYSWRARLNGDYTWGAATSDSQRWIQADIGYQTYVSGVVTQGDGGFGVADWVESLQVSTFLTDTSDEDIFVQDKDGVVMVNSIFACLNFLYNPSTTWIRTLCISNVPLSCYKTS